MIEKIPNKHYTLRDIFFKINELVDAVNVLRSAKDAMFITIRDIQNIVTALDDPTYHKAEPEPVENVPGPIKLYVCPDGSVYDSLDVAKSHTSSIFNLLPAGATTTDRVYLERELDHIRKALNVAVDVLRHADWFFDGDYNVSTKDMHNEIRFTIKAIERINNKEQQ